MRMKKTYMLLLVAVMFTVSGCDFFRKLAGRPTSDVIEAKRMEMLADIQKKEIREQEIRDSIAAVQKAEQDSVETLQWLKDNGVMIIDASRFGGITADPYLDWGGAACVVTRRQRTKKKNHRCSVLRNGTSGDIIMCKRI